MCNQKDYGITDIGTWLEDNKRKIFRYNVYKKVWTPKEMESKYIDESIFEDGGYTRTAYITNAIEIPNDVILELDEVTEDWDENNVTFTKRLGTKNYYKLSDICLCINDSDNELPEDNEDYNPEED